MQRIDTRTSQLGLVGGSRQPASDLILIAEPASPFTPEARKGRLYLVVETGSDPARAAQACQLVARTIQRVFYQDSSFSVTAGLRAAIRAANKALYEQNMSQPARQRAQVGCTCAVLKDGELFVAQVQPAQAYVLTEGKLRALPAHPSWDPAHVSVAPFTQAGALGASLFIEPELYRCTMRAGDAAILCASGFAHLLGRADAEGALRAGAADQIADELARLAEASRLADAHALAIELRPALSPAAQREPLSPAAVGERSRLAARSLGGWLARLGGELAPRPRGRREEPEEPAEPRPDPLRVPPPQPTHSPNPPPRPTPINMGESLSARYERERLERTSRERSRRLLPQPEPARELPPSSFLGEGDYPSPQRRIDLGDGPALAAGARPYRPRHELRPMVDLTWGERLTLPFRQLAVTVEDRWRARRSRRPPSQPRPIPRGQGLSYRRTRPPFPWLLLLGLIAAIGGLVAYGLTLSQQNEIDLTQEYFTIAEQRVAEVRTAPDEATALDRLEVARQAIDEVRASPEVTRTNIGFWTRFQELQLEYERSLATVQRLTFFDSPELLAEHPLPTGRFQTVIVPPPLAGITDTAVLDGLRYIYTIDADAESAQLYRIPRDGGRPEPFLTPNQAVGNTVVGPLRAALWRIDQVVAVDEADSGFGYYFRQNNVWSYSKLGASEIWNVPERLDIEEYLGNLYVWGAQPNEILKFDSGRYGDSPVYWIDQAGLGETDLSTVTDISVDISIYLLRTNGSVVVMSAGSVIGEIKPGSITPPISAVTRFVITGTPEEGSIFMLEPINERIIQIDKLTGAVIQQIKVRPDSDLQLSALTALHVDASGSRPTLYIVNGGQIIRANLPAPPRAFREDGSPEPAPTAAP